MKLRHLSTAFLVTCLLLCSQGQAEVIAIGDVDPSGATDPWEIDGELKVGNSGEGILEISNGGVVTSSGGRISSQSDSVGTVTVTGQGSEWNNGGGSLGVGRKGEGTLNITDGGVVTNGYGYLGRFSDSVGTVTVAGEGSEWNNSSELYVGRSGEGTLNIESGGVVSNTDGIIGSQFDSVGTVTVTGQGSEWNNRNNLDMGNYVSAEGLRGSGTLSVMAGGVVSNKSGIIGQLITVTVTGEGSKWNNSSHLHVNGTLNITDGGVVTNTNSGYIGYSSVGTVTVTGEGSEWKNSSFAALYVGGYDDGTLNIESGGVVSSGYIYIGQYGSVGTVTVTGEGSLWNTSFGLEVGRYGEGTLNIEGGGTVNVAEETWAAREASSSGVINLNNGTLNTGGLISSLGNLQGTGTINTHGLVTDIDLIFDRPSSLSQSWVLDDPGQNISLNLEVDGTGSIGAGYEGTALLLISGGVAVESQSGYLGYKAGSSGTAFVVGEGSEWNNSWSLYVGHSGEGTLNITDGGVVSNRMGHIGGAPAHGNPYLESSGVGTVTVTGEGSRWNNSSSLAVGQYGEGTLNIESGGVVSSGYGHIGDEEGSVGTVTVTGEGSEWNQSGVLKVGYLGEGTLNIESGGVVSSGYGHIGDEEGSVGTVTVTGEGSEWNQSGVLKVGYLGEGTLNIESGGVVSNTYGYIGYYFDSVGTATVAGEGSEWNNSDDLYVGDQEGTLNITGGGTVNVDGTTSVGDRGSSIGVINFDNGTLNTGTLNTGGLISSLGNLQGTGTINTHGLVSDVNLIFDRPSSLSQSFALDDPGQNITLNLEVDGTGNIGVGYEGTALLLISGGVAVESQSGYLGYKAGSSGTAFVVGEGSEWNNSGGLTVGRWGEGTLNIEGGGVVTNTNSGYIGYYSVGTVTVAGEGSEWNNSESLSLGYYGEGTLNIASGGVVSDTNGWIGHYSVGTVTVTGEGSVWNNSEDLYVGYLGEGTLNITDGGVVNIAGTTTLNNSTLHIELSDTTSGPSLITDSLELGGTLEISLADGFLPALGNTFDILDFNTVSGSFSEMNLPALEDGLLWDTSQRKLLIDGTICVGACIPLAGDFNVDGVVNSADYTRWKNNLGNNSLALNGNGSGALTVGQADYDLWKENFGRSGAGIGDFNSDGVIDAADFTVWQDNLGQSASAHNGNGSGAATVVQADYLLWKTNFEALASGSSESVPEPTTAILVLMICVGCFRSRL
jgi:T5SS/PEP-CTERM-associated repeat protein